jgi:prevent-host-death family protein
MEIAMGKVWTLQDAKNKFSAVVEAAQRGEPQHVTKRGVDAVVVLSAEEYERLSKLDAKPKKTFVQHILDFPKLPEGMEDIFDDRDQYPSSYRDIDLD